MKSVRNLFLVSVLSLVGSFQALNASEMSPMDYGHGHGRGHHRCHHHHPRCHYRCCRY